MKRCSAINETKIEVRYYRDRWNSYREASTSHSEMKEDVEIVAAYDIDVTRP